MEKFDEIAAQYRDWGEYITPDLVRTSIPDARDLLRSGLDYCVRHYTGGRENNAVWAEKNYAPVADWLTDNGGRGLLLIGGCGLGKTMIATRIIPLLLLRYCRKNATVCTARELAQDPDPIMARHIIVVDDVGTESMSNIYGNKRVPFAELCDAAERRGKLLIVTSNLTADEIKARYGERVIDRLRAITKPIVFSGKSMRK